MMSEQQKVFASLSGAVIAHILLLMLVFLLIATESTPSSLSAAQKSTPKPTEVTILMSDLMEQIEIEPPAPEIPSPPEARRRSFFPTDTNPPEANAPENATYISDRNTTAATEILPDPALPQQEGPTTAGDAPIPYLRLQERDFVDGRLDRPAASRPQAEAGASETQVGSAAVASEATRRGIEEGSGEGEEAVDGADTPPENPVAETMQRPPVARDDGEEEETARQKSFTDPNSTIEGLPEFDEGNQDRFAAAIPETMEAEEGEAADLIEKVEQRSGIADGEGTGEVGNAKEDAEAGQQMKAGDVGLFADDGFSPFERQNRTNGTLSNLGQNAVDAEESAAGKYEAAVRAAVARQWHRYRVEHGDFVTYGFLKLRCRVDRHGDVHDLKVIENKANAVLTDFSLRAILDADVPPMPEEVAREYGPKGLELNYDVIIY